MNGRSGDRHLSEELLALVSRVDTHGRRDKARAAGAWSRVAGPDVACHTKGIALRERELLVYVDSPVWANELSLLSPRYAAAVNAEVGQDLVETVRFSVSRRVTQEAEQLAAERDEGSFYERDGVEPVPLDEAEREQVAHSVAPIQNERVRLAVEAAMTRHLELSKGRRERARKPSSEGV